MDKVRRVSSRHRGLLSGMASDNLCRLGRYMFRGSTRRLGIYTTVNQSTAIPTLPRHLVTFHRAVRLCRRVIGQRQQLFVGMVVADVVSVSVGMGENEPKVQEDGPDEELNRHAGQRFLDTSGQIWGRRLLAWQCGAKEAKINDRLVPS